MHHIVLQYCLAIHFEGKGLFLLACDCDRAIQDLRISPGLMCRPIQICQYSRLVLTFILAKTS